MYHKFHKKSSLANDSNQEFVKITRNRVRIIFRKDQNSNSNTPLKSSLKVKIPAYKPTKITLYDGNTIKKLSENLSSRPAQTSTLQIPHRMPLQF